MRRVLSALSHLQTAFVRFVGSALQLVLGLVIAHYYGAAELGTFLVFVAVTNILGAVTGGLPSLLIRYASQDEDTGRHPVGWLWRHSLTLTGVALLFSAGAALLGQSTLRDQGLAVAGLLAQRASSAALKARRRPMLAILLDTALYPLVVLAFVLAAASAGWTEVAEGLRLSYAAALWGAALVGVVLGWRHAGSLRAVASAPWRTPREVYREIGRVTSGAAAGTIAANVPIAIAPLFLTGDSVGSLGLALRVAGFATTLLVSLNAQFGPAYARARSGQELRRLRRQGQVASLSLYLPIIGAFLLIPSAWLEAVDPGLGSVKGLVAILAVGYAFSAGSGLNSSLLVMRGHARTYARVSTAVAWITVAAVVAGAAVAGAWGLAGALSLVLSGAALVFYRAAGRAIDAEERRTEAGDPYLQDAAR